MRIAYFNNNFFMFFDIFDSLASSNKKTFKDSKMIKYNLTINNARKNKCDLDTIDTLLWCCNFGLTANFL